MWKQRVQVTVIRTLLSDAEYSKGLGPDATPEAEFLQEKFSVDRLRAWFGSTKAQGAKARMNDKATTGAAGRRPPTKFQEKRAAFFGHNNSVCKPDLVREAQRAKGAYSPERAHSPERAQRLGGNGHVASAATRNVSFSSGAEGGLGGGSAGALTGSTSPPPDSGARATSTPLVLFNAGPDVGGSAWGGRCLL